METIEKGRKSENFNIQGFWKKKMVSESVIEKLMRKN